MNNNMKCRKCGYTFHGNESAPTGNCPLCGEEYNTPKALEYYDATKGDTENNSRKSLKKMIIDWVIFGLSFGTFIIIMYILIGIIAGLEGKA